MCLCTSVYSMFLRFVVKASRKLNGLHTISKCKIHLIWKVEVWLEPHLVWYMYNVGTYTCSSGQRSQIEIKGYKWRSEAMSGQFVRYPENVKLNSFAYLRIELEPYDPNRCGIKVSCQFASFTNCNGRRDQWSWDRKLFWCYKLATIMV